MKLVDDLRGVDQRLLPDAARRFAAFVDAARRASSLTRRHIHPLPARMRAGLLDSLDAAIASKRWGLPARRPTVALLAAVAVLIGGLSVAATRPAPGHKQAVPTTDAGVDSTYVGPHVGDQVDAYVASRQEELDRQVRANGSAMSVAVVSFTDYQSIEAAAAFISGVTPRRVFFGVHIPTVPTEVGQATVVDFVPDTTAAFRANAKARARLALTFKQLSDAAPARTAPEKKFRTFYRNFAEANRIESAQLAKLCSCVFGVVVEGSRGALKTLAESGAVRLVDIAPEGVPVNRLGFRAISPAEKGKITSGPASPLSDLGR